MASSTIPVRAMKIALFPLASSGVHPEASALARRLALCVRLLDPEIRDATVAVEWVARRGRERRPVRLAQPLPIAEVRRIAELRGCDGWMDGALRWSPSSWELTLRRGHVGSDALVETTSRGVDTAELLDAVARAAREDAGSPDGRGRFRLPPGALHALVLDLDRVPPGVARLPGGSDDARLLLDALRAAPEHVDLRARLDERIERLVQEGRSADALSAALQRARIRPGEPAEWQRVAELAALRSEIATEREALERLIELDDVAPSFCLRAGARLVRRQQNELGIRFLERARVEESCRWEAALFLGVALARIGRLRDAIPLWRDIVARCDDPRCVDAARTNLRRACVEDE